MRSPLFVAALAALSLAVVGCQPKSSGPEAPAELPADLRSASLDRAAQLQSDYSRDVAGAKVGAVTEVKTVDGTVFIAAEVADIPRGALAVVIDQNEQQVGVVKAFNAAGNQTYFEVVSSDRPITPGDFVVRFPEGTAVELQPVGGPST